MNGFMCDSEALIRRGAALPKGLGGLVLLVPAALQRVVANGNSEFRHLRARALDHFRPKFGEANLLLTIHLQLSLHLVCLKQRRQLSSLISYPFTV